MSVWEPGWSDGSYDAAPDPARSPARTPAPEGMYCMYYYLPIGSGSGFLKSQVPDPHVFLCIRIRTEATPEGMYYYLQIIMDPDTGS